MPAADQSRKHIGELNERKNHKELQNHLKKPPGSKIRSLKTRPSPETKLKTVYCRVKAKCNSSTKIQ
ncbi:hypothetical protein GA0061098_10613 [Bradyrhizobium shewense]|uniref:Uncharacterized protein n=1 Tax=Bradyrhizobium shewense TaxID=1761772 RepID=A0A1C3XUG7_9BRAD|nr:hypothetical protein GA0061098_10613 [Bradyrhizobium shewense]